jgi:hypothetical protein
MSAKVHKLTLQQVVERVPHTARSLRRDGIRALEASPEKDKILRMNAHT